MINWAVMCSTPFSDDRAHAVRRAGALALVSIVGLSAWGCSSGGSRPPAGGSDAAVQLDAASPPLDADSRGPDQGAADLAGPRADLAALTDLGKPSDLAVPADLGKPSDLAVPSDLATASDLAFPSVTGVDIYVDNFCKMDVVPKVFNVPRGVTLKVTWHNRSRDYPVTVWLSYGGGYTDLMTGGSWAEPIEHCRLPRPYYEYADISTACSSYRLMMNCL